MFLQLSVDEEDQVFVCQEYGISQADGNSYSQASLSSPVKGASVSIRRNLYQGVLAGPRLGGHSRFAALVPG